MPPKSKGEKINLKQKQKTDMAIKGDDDSSLAQRRTRREPKSNYQAFKDDEEAQMELAIKLSLQAQRQEERRKNGDGEHELTKPKIKMASVDNEKKEQTKRKHPTTQISAEVEKPPKKNVSSASMSKSSPVKRRKMEYMLDIDKALKGDKIPSTASFISYVLQKGSRNRDMNLVKQFEREESQEPLNVASHTESESDWEIA